MNERTQNVLSGFRPTSDLTIGNYFGAIKPALDIQSDESKKLTIFVADLHGLTDHKPSEIEPYRKTVVHDCLALGIDPDKTTLYLQSDIEAPITQIANRISPYVSVAELARTPNLKEKLEFLEDSNHGRNRADAMKSNAALLNYPILMAADIFSQQAELVAVGQDQEPHLEITRKIAKRLNRELGSMVVVEPRILAIDALRIMSLDGKGKMSKTNPNQAILLTDDPEYAKKKISKAATASTGQWNAVINSHFTIAKGLTRDMYVLQELDVLKARHMGGTACMKDFKDLWAELVMDKIDDFQTKRAAINDKDVDAALRKGESHAFISAQRVLDSIKERTGF